MTTYRKSYNKLQEIRRELNELREAQRDAERRTEMLTFQAEEIESARLKRGEEESLRLERDRLANAESLSSLAEQAALAFRLFTGETFPARKVLAALKGTRRWPID